jgi:hypothetical protein
MCNKPDELLGSSECRSFRSQWSAFADAAVAVHYFSHLPAHKNNSTEPNRAGSLALNANLTAADTRGHHFEVAFSAILASGNHLKDSVPNVHER